MQVLQTDPKVQDFTPFDLTLRIESPLDVAWIAKIFGGHSSSDLSLHANVDSDLIAFLNSFGIDPDRYHRYVDERDYRLFINVMKRLNSASPLNYSCAEDS